MSTPLLVWNPFTNNLDYASSGGGGGSISLNPFGTTPNAQGLTLSGTTLNMEPASLLFPGGISTGAQSFSGVKSFASAPIFSSLTGILTANAASALTVSTVTNHGVLIGGAANTLSSTAVGLTGQMLQGVTASNPVYSTSTWPGTTTINSILYSSAANVVGQIPVVNNGVLITSSSGVPSLLPLSTDTYVLTITAGAISWQPPSAGGSISLAAFGTNPNANGMTLTGSVLNLEYASASFGGSISTAAQSFSGVKSFVAAPIFSSLTGILTANGSSALTASTVTEHGVIIGGSGNSLNSTSVGLTGQMLQGVTGSDPTYSTATYPSTTTINDIFYSSSANVVSQIATTVNGVLITSNTGVPSFLPNSANAGWVLTNTPGSPAAWAAPGSGGVASVSGTLNRVTSSGGANPVIDISSSFAGQTSLTILGTVATGVWNATPIGAAYGGSGTNTLTGILTGNGTSPYTASTVTNHGVLLGGSANSVSSTAVGLTGTVLQGVTGSDPTYSTATYPSTTTLNSIFYSSSANVVGQIPVVNNGVLITSASGVPSFLPLSTDTYVLTINAGAISWQPASGSGITLSPFGSTPNANGMTLTGSALNLEYASASFGGSVSTAAQSFAGTKTFSSSPIFSSLTGVLTANGSSALTASTVTQHGVVIAGAANALSSTAVGLTGQMLQGVTASDPAYSTATYPSTTTVNTILYSSSANVVDQLATLINGVLVTDNSGVPFLLANSTTPAFVLTSVAGGAPSWQVVPLTLTLAAFGSTPNANGLTLTGTALNLEPADATHGGSVSITSQVFAGTKSFSSAPIFSTLTGVLTANGSSALTASTVTQHGVVLGSSANGLSTTAVGLTGTILQGVTGADPTYSTATYPSTTTINNLLYSSASNVIGQIASVNNGVLITSASGVPSFLPNSANTGWVLTNTSGSPAAWAAPVSTIWSNQATSFTSSAANGYFITATSVVATLPASPTVGQTVTFDVSFAGTTTVQAATGQFIRIGQNLSSSAGTAVNTNIGDSLTLVYQSSSTTWQAVSYTGVWGVA